MLMLEDLDRCLGAFLLLPARKVINPLFSFLLHQDDAIRWRAVTAFGAVVSALADRDRESARVIMRRLMWSLNDESGGIGWGAPEAMAEVIARNDALEREFGAVFVSYMDPDGNFLEYPPLQRGLLWGLARLAETRPACVANAVTFLAPYFDSADPVIRALAARSAGLLRAELLRPAIESLVHDETEIRLFREDRFVYHTVGSLAREALDLLDKNEGRGA